MIAKRGSKKAGGGPASAQVGLKILPALTTKQAECLLFIFNFYSSHRHFPTHREIAAAMNVRSNTAVMYLEPLIEKGYLALAASRQPRNVRLTEDGLEKLRLMGVNV
jgi:Mn-dependent DtxR family transcriptional regulator